jgi:hypothetical protein
MAFCFHFYNVANKVSIIHKPISSNFAIKKKKKENPEICFWLLEPCIEICLFSFFELLDFLAQSY